MSSLISLSIKDLANIDVTTPTKSHLKLCETPATVRIISSREIEERGYFTLEDALSDIPGIQFRNILGFNSYVFMRGIPAQNNLVLVMIDGVQINELNSGGFYGGGQYNLSNVDRIEVIYGPASALYGTNSVSGIINIITKNPKNINGLRTTSLVGNFNTQQHDFVFGSYDKKKDLGISVSAMFKKSDKADLRDARGDNNWSDSIDNFEEDIAFDAKAQYKTLTFGLNYQNKETSYATKEKVTGTRLTDTGTNWDISFLNTYVKYDLEKSDRWSYHSMLYYRDSTVLDNTLPIIYVASGTTPGYQERWYRPNHLWGFENRLNSELSSKLSIVLGIVRESESLASGFSKSKSTSWDIKPSEPVEPEMLSNDLMSVYSQLQWRLSDPLIMTFGSRFDDSSVYGKVLTPRASLVFNKNKFTAKLLSTEAYRAPKPWDYKDGIGNQELDPEKMKSLELNLGYSFTNYFRAEISTYRNTLTNALKREQLGDDWRWINVGHLDTTGIETNLEFAKGRYKSYLNFTTTNSENENGQETAEISPHTLNMGLNYAFNQRLNLDLRGQYIGKRKNMHAFGSSADEWWVDDAYILNGALNFKTVRGYDCQLSVRNILDEEYYHTSNSSVSRYRQPQLAVMLRISRQF
ncbi:MAG: TonB-dependent receptor [Candidatus Riflebacteria bacterium]|nr:TonB-dependent receptor [Candidatus Riflebacteria bacterium]